MARPGRRESRPCQSPAGGKKPSAELLGGHPPAANGAILVGDKGTMYSIEWTGGDWHLLPKAKFEGYVQAARDAHRGAAGRNGGGFQK